KQSGQGPVQNLCYRPRLVLSANNVQNFLVEKPPTFSLKLVPSRLVKTGQPLTLSCKVEDSPGLSVKWFRNGCEIISNYRQLVRFSNSVASLEVIDNSVDDSGEYVCVASSAAGSNHCSYKHGWTLDVCVIFFH
uniref:Ig-like domain-containing protein n=1 Tax=Gadus morhua TaxID=8049 RepID=A0A8C5FAG8_GADMO